MPKQYARRDAEFEKWFQSAFSGYVSASERALIRHTFNMGWAARKRVDIETISGLTKIPERETTAS